MGGWVGGGGAGAGPSSPSPALKKKSRGGGGGGGGTCLKSLWRLRRRRKIAPIVPMHWCRKGQVWALVQRYPLGWGGAQGLALI